MSAVLTDFITPAPTKEQIGAIEDNAIIIAKMWQTLFDDTDLMFAWDEDFFILGASSLLAVNLVTAIQNEFGIEFSLRKLLTATRFCDLVTLVSDIQGESGTNADANNGNTSDEIDDMDDMDVVVI
jgi:acyl carrier protein